MEHEFSDEGEFDSIGGFLENLKEIVFKILKDEVNDSFFAEGFL